MTTADPERLGRLADEVLRWSDHGRGYQVAVLRDGDLVASAGGDGPPGRPMETTTSHNLWCATKPLVACVALAALERHGVDLDDAPSALAGGADDPLALRPDLTWRRVLAHEGGLSRSGLALARLHGVEEIDRLVAEDLAAETVEQGYSELTGWWLLSRAIAAGHGADPIGVTEGALAAAGLDGIRFGYAEEEDLPRHRLGVYYEPQPGGGSAPLPHDGSRRALAERHLCYGANLSVVDLVRWYGLVLDHLAADGPTTDLLPSAALLRTVLETPHQSSYRSAFDAEVSFAGGFMRDLDRFLACPAVPADAIGHIGWLGSSVALADPASGTVVGVLLNGTRVTPRTIEDRARFLAAVLTPVAA